VKYLKRFKEVRLRWFTDRMMKFLREESNYMLTVCVTHLTSTKYWFEFETTTEPSGHLIFQDAFTIKDTTYITEFLLEPKGKFSIK